MLIVSGFGMHSTRDMRLESVISASMNGSPKIEDLVGCEAASQAMRVAMSSVLSRARGSIFILRLGTVTGFSGPCEVAGSGATFADD